MSFKRGEIVDVSAYETGRTLSYRDPGCVTSRFIKQSLGIIKIDWIPALQGAFLEHQAVLQGLTYKINILPLLVKSVEELERCDALIIPGGGNLPSIS